MRVFRSSHRRFGLFAAVLFSACRLHAATYYVDFAGGNDSRAGTSPEQGWKHCPGDAKAADKAASTRLEGGDTVIFKGGVEYPGDLNLGFSGAPGRPITLDGNTAGTFGKDRAIFSGAEHIEVHPCKSQAEAGGTKDWQACFAADLPHPVDPLAVNLFYGDKRGGVARSPNATDPMWWQDLNCFEPIADADITPTTINLGKYALPPGEQWTGAYVGIWNIVNLIVVDKIEGVSPDGKTITFKKTDLHSRDRHYALFNHPSLLDAEGEYIVVNAGRRLVFHGGPGPGGKVPDITIAGGQYGINLNGKAHWVIRGLVLRNYAGGFTDQRAGSGITSWEEGNARPEDIAIDNCVVTNNQSLNRAGGLQLAGVKGLRVENCHIEGNQGSRGTLCANCEDVVLRKNTYVANGGTAIAFFKVKNGVIEDNNVTRHLGMHANGISVYLGSENVTVQRNYVNGGEISLTLQSSRNVKIDYNVLVTDADKASAMAIWPAVKDLYPANEVYIRNNTMLCPGTNGFLVNDKAATGLHVFNNIISGGGVANGPQGESSHNLYTVRSWVQAKPDWKPEPGQVEAPAEKVFVDALKADFHLAADSPAITAGINWGQKTDAEGKPVTAATPDLGAYQK